MDNVIVDLLNFVLTSHPCTIIAVVERLSPKHGEAAVKEGLAKLVADGVLTKKGITYDVVSEAAATSYLDERSKALSAEQETKYKQARDLMEQGRYDDASKGFKDIANFKDSAEKMEVCISLAKKSEEYRECVASMRKAPKKASEWSELGKRLTALGDFLDSKEKASECQKACQKRKKKKALVTSLTVGLGLVAIAFGVLTPTVFVPSGKYNQAMALIDSGRYDEADALLNGLNWKDAQAQIELNRVRRLFAAGEMSSGLNLFFDSSLSYSMEATIDPNGGEFRGVAQSFGTKELKIRYARDWEPFELDGIPACYLGFGGSEPPLTATFSDGHPEGSRAYYEVESFGFDPYEGSKHEFVFHFNLKAIWRCELCSVTFQRPDGGVLQSSFWPKGYTPTYSGEKVFYDAPSKSYCSISSWDKPLSPVSGNVIYTATVVQNKAFFKGQDGFYYGGLYPQTVVEDSNLKTALASATDTDSDGYLEYGSDEYKKTIGAPDNPDYKSVSGNTAFTTGTDYYFKVEPIQWRALSGDGTAAKLVMSEKILDKSPYYTSISRRTVSGSTVYANNYQYSTLRAMLNGYDGSAYSVDNFAGKGFLDLAFTEAEKASITASTVDNSYVNGSTSYKCPDTSDRIFAPSYMELTNTSYGFSSSSSSDSSRRGVLTDYARATGANMLAHDNSYGAFFSFSGYGTGRWATRTPDYGEFPMIFVAAVAENGGILQFNNQEEVTLPQGIRPCLALNAD